MKYISNYNKLYKKLNYILFNEIPKFQVGGAQTKSNYYERLNLNKNDIKGKRVLDAGCGSGWMMKKTLTYNPKELIGIDLNENVTDIYNYLEGCNYKVMQMNLMSLDFPDDSFDTIYCWGVLQHTPDFERCFNELVRVLKPDGKLSIYVYSYHQELLKPLISFHRKWTTKIPFSWLYFLSMISVPLAYIYKLPLFKFLQFVFPIRLPKKPRYYVKLNQWKEIWLCTLDDYLNTYWNTYTYEYVYSLFKKHFRNIDIVEPPISISGVKL